MGILDTILTTNQQQALERIETKHIVTKLLTPLKDREKQILMKRFGLLGHPVATLKSVGQEQGLTRERVRQIEKELLKQMRKNAHAEVSFAEARDFIVGLVNEHGGVMAENRLIEILGTLSEDEANSLRFLLNLIEDLRLLQDEHVKPSWTSSFLNKDVLKQFVVETKKMLTEYGRPLHPEVFIEKFKEIEFFIQNELALPEKIIVNYLHSVLEVERNIFGEFGLHFWSEVKPKDVGDKAYLVMKHHGKPEHYSVITELINKHNLDKRTAYKETVHNKLIKDKRFVLVGRGMYALAEWGYKPGVVSDMIVEILKKAGKPLTRDEIVEKVLQRRMVKNNTILVGLSNKKLFKKVGKNLYALA